MTAKTVTVSAPSFASLLTLVFITLKLTGAIAWSWLWVLSPLWISFALWLLLLALFLLGALITYKADRGSRANTMP